MADANTEVTLEALHTAIQLQIAAAFPDFRTVEFYRDDEDERMSTPACLLEMSEAEPQPERDSGTGQWSVQLRFEARIVMAHRDGTTPLEVRKAATALATWLNLRRWGADAPGDPCQVIACEPDEFAPHQPRFRVWRVEWVQRVDLGESAWLNPGGAVPDAFYSWAPQIGAAHEEDYRPLANGVQLP